MTDTSLTATKSPPEITSLLSQMSNIQTDRERMMKEIDNLNKELSGLKENKREEMRKVFDTVIQRWLTASVNDENTRKQFSDGMERIIEKTQDQGVWTVAVEASNLHARQIDELEKLRAECDQLKSQTNESGTFKDESSRKRSRDEASKSNSFWEGFELGPV
jgi:sulfur transfer protein SufE